MLRATRVIPRDDVTATTDYVVLDYDARHRRRFAMTSVGNVEFLLDLADAVVLREGDALALEDGRAIEIRAMAERLVVVTGTDAQHLARLAWHLGNRHVPTEVRSDCLRIRDDHVMVEMIRGLGGEMQFVTEPFQPEHGAYHEH